MEPADTLAADDAAAETSIVDCDVHILTVPEEVLREKLPPRHRERPMTIPSPGYENPHGRVISHEGMDLLDGDRPGITIERHLDAHDVEAGIISGSTTLMGIALHPNRDYAAEVARVHNEYVAETWLPRDERFYASVVVAPQAPDRAVELIHEYGARPEFVQVVMGSSTDEAYGHPRFWPIYEAAVEHDLPVAIHTANDGAGTSDMPTPGHPPNYFAWHNMLPSVYMGHVNSLVVEGVFCEYPELRFVCIEGGFAWVPHLMWRMDKNWRSLRDQAPWLSEPPSHYIRRNVRFTTQPVVEPDRPEHLLQLFEMMDAERTLMFSGDFPHWDIDDPGQALPSETPADLRARIMGENARAIYELPERSL